MFAMSGFPHRWRIPQVSITSPLISHTACPCYHDLIGCCLELNFTAWTESLYVTLRNYVNARYKITPDFSPALLFYSSTTTSSTSNSSNFTSHHNTQLNIKTLFHPSKSKQCLPPVTPTLAISPTAPRRKSQKSPRREVRLVTRADLRAWILRSR